MKPAILFDIDGTLLYAKGLGREAFGEAFERAYHASVDMARVSFVGGTDTAIIRQLARDCGCPTSPAIEERFFLEFTTRLDAKLAAGPILVYPGIPQLLARLVADGALLGLVTGNIRPTAWSKLHHAGLDTYFTFGGYACDHEDRAHIAAAAMQRATAHAATPRLLIGDTPKDIAAAHANGLPCLAVATGWVSAEKLSAAGADAVLTDFADTEKALACIWNLCHD